MDARDRILSMFKKGEVPDIVAMMWETIVWCVKHTDVIEKIMDGSLKAVDEREQIEKFLLNEKRYELYVAMLCYDSSKKFGMEMNNGNHGECLTNQD